MHVILQDIFRRRVREELSDQELSQSELARRMGVTPSTVNQYLSGKIAPGIDMVEQFALALGFENPLDLLNERKQQRKKLQPAS